MTDTYLKICVVGPCRSGKTLVSKILGQQLFTWTTEGYAPTQGLRIQEASVIVDVERIHLQLWDCSGDLQYRKYWPLFAEEMDGLLMIFHPDDADPTLMEKLHKAFVLKRNLKQRPPVLLMALRANLAEQPAGTGEGKHFQGKLQELPFVDVHVSMSDIDLSSKILVKNLRPFLQECLQKKQCC